MLYWIVLMCCWMSSLQSVEEIVMLDKNVKFINGKGDFVFYYPSNWEKRENMPGLDLFVMAPHGADGRSRANISIISGELPPEVDLDTYYKENMKNLMKNKTVRIIDAGRYEIGGFSSKWARYFREDDQTEIIHYFLVADGKGYLITCGAAKEAFGDYVEAFESIVKTFAFLPKAKAA